MLAEQAAHIGAREIVIDLEKDLQAAIADEGFPAIIVHDLELRQILRDEQELDAKAGGLRDRMLDHFHAPQTGEFIEHEQALDSRIAAVP